MSKKIPVVLQMSAADCGAACLTMIVRYWGGNISSKTCQAAMGTAADGSTALIISQTARQFGLDVQGFRHTIQGVSQAELPAIIHWQGMHFVVLVSWGKETVNIIDPAVGRRTMSHQEFSEKYSGVTLSFTPRADFDEVVAEYANAAGALSRRGQAYTFLKRLWTVPHSKAIAGQILLSSLALQLLGLALPLMTWLVVEKILPNPGENSLALLSVVVAMTIFSQAAMTYWRSIVTIHLQQQLDSSLIPDFFSHLLSLPYPFFQRRTTGDLVSRLAGNTVIREIITSGILTGLLDGGLAIFYLLILYMQAPLFGLIVSVAAIGQFILLFQTNEQLHEYNQITLATRAEEDGFTVQMVSGIESIKGMGAESWMFAQWQERFSETIKTSVIYGRYIARINSLLQFLTFGTPFILLWVGTYLVQTDRLNLGTMLALVVLASSSLIPLTNLTHHMHRAQQLWAYLERLSDVLESEPERQTLATTEPLQLQGHIEVANVSFSYRQNGSFDLQDVSCVITPGTKVALVGQSGAGKSTLMRLLLGLYPLEQGAILYDKRQLTEVNLTNLRQSVGVVLQDPFIFSGTIMQNIAWHQADVSIEKIIAAAKTAVIHDEIQRLPMGYETWVGEGGSGLSGGQKQRIALARALVNEPSVLFLDEATSHLDTATEKRIYQALDQLPITQLIIAHRLSSVHNADQILVLENGRLVENGRSDELLAKDGVYHALVRAQRY